MQSTSTPKQAGTPALPLRSQNTAASADHMACLDAESRSYLDRPTYVPPFGRVLYVILITAIVAAVGKVAWIAAMYLIGG